MYGGPERPLQKEVMVKPGPQDVGDGRGTRYLKSEE